MKLHRISKIANRLFNNDKSGWTVVLFPEDGWKKPQVIKGAISYKIIPSPAKPWKSYVSFDLAQGGHLTVLFETGSQKAYRKFELYGKKGNFVLGQGHSGRSDHGFLPMPTKRRTFDERTFC